MVEESHNNTERDSIPEVAFKASPDQVASFLLSLLGTQQTISGGRVESFVLRKEFFLLLANILKQRVRAQDTASLVSEKYEIGYAGGYKETLRRIELFDHLDVQKRRCSENVVMSFDFVIQFPGYEGPEKQSIKISCYNAVPLYASLFDGILKTGLEGSKELGLFQYEIETTNRTWGEDIESLIREAFEKEIENSERSKLQKFAKFVLDNRFTTMLVPVLSCAVSLFLYLTILPYLYPGWTSRVENFLSKENGDLAYATEGINLILDFLYNNYGYAIFITLLIITIMAMVIFIGAARRVFLYGPKSFVILNDYTERQYKKHIRLVERSRNVSKWILSTIGAGFLTSVVLPYVL